MEWDEVNEFAGLNKKVEDRNEAKTATIYEDQAAREKRKARVRRAAVKKLVWTLTGALISLILLSALAELEMISGSLCIILMNGIAVYGAFKAGYIWREIKK